MTVRKSARKRAPVKPVIPPTSQEFREQARKMLDDLLDDYPGTDCIAFIVDGRSGSETASIPSAKSIKEGLILSVSKQLFGDTEA